MLNDLAIPKTLEDYAKSRDMAIVQYKSALKLLNNAEDSLNEVCQFAFPHDAMPKLSKERFIELLDQRLWRSAFDATGFNKYMDQKARKEFDDSLEREPPKFTVENIRSIFLSISQDADKMFNRGVAEIFRRLKHNYETNKDQVFSIGRKFIAEWMFGPSWRTTGIVCKNTDVWNDLDRVVKVCAGVDFIPRSLESSLNDVMKNGAGSVYEDEYYRIKGYKKGTAHIELKCSKVIESINNCIAEYYGENKVASNREAA